MQWTLFLLSCVIVTLCPVASHASNAAEKSPLFTLSLKDLLQIPVSSSTLTPKALKAAPASISILTRSQLDSMPYRYLHEVLNHIPGFQAFRQGEAGDEYYHSVRGRRVGTASREVLILVNGVRLNRESDNATGVPSMLLANVEKIEFIRGPGSALYGSNAFMGVISITTQVESKDFRVGVSDTGMLNLSGSNSWYKSGWSVNTHAYLEDDPGQDYTVESNFDHSLNNTDDATQKADFRLAVSHQHFSAELAHYQRQALHYYVVENFHKRNRTANRFSYADIKNQYSLGANWQLHLGLNYSDAKYQPQSVFAEEGFASAFGGSDPPSDEAYKVNAEQHERTLKLSFLNDWALGESQSVQFGGEYRKIRFDPLILAANFDLNVVPIRYVGDSFAAETAIAEAANLEILGAFVQYQASITNDLDMILGVRRDDYPNQQTEYSPRLAFVWNIAAAHVVKLLYGEAFRSPTINEKYVTGNVSVIGNPNLEAEVVKTLELNWQGDFENYNIGVSIFDSTIDNAIAQDFVAETRTFINNVENKHIRGVEGEFNWALAHNWRLSANTSHIFDSPESQFRQASHLGSLTLNYGSNIWSWTGALHYAGRRAMQVDDDLMYLNHYVNAASSLTYQMQAGQRLSLNITNIFDKDYLTPSQGQVLQQGLPNRGREISLQYAKRF